MIRCTSWRTRRSKAPLSGLLAVALVAGLLGLLVGPARPISATTLTFSNPSSITINDGFPPPMQATPYPSTIAVSGVVGSIVRVTVTLDGLSHLVPDDVAVLLVSPGGKTIKLMSDVGGGTTPVNNVRLTFEDTEPPLPDTTQITSGTYRPTAGTSPGYSFDQHAPTDFPAPAPASPYSLFLSDLIGTSANGTWSLYIIDDSYNGAGGTVSAGWSLTISANVAPTAVNDSAITDHDTPVTIDVLANDSDADGTLDPTTVGVISSPTHGSTVLNTTTGTLTYTPAAGYGGPDSFTYSVRDNQGTVSNTATVTLTVNGANDSPVNTVPSTQTTPANTPLVFSTANGNAISVSDVDAGSGSLQVTLGVTSGTLTLGSTTGLTVTGDGTATVVATGMLGPLNAGLQGLTFTPAYAGGGIVTLTITTNDQGNTGLGGARSDTDTATIVVGGLPSLSVNDVRVTEGNSGIANALFTVTLSAASNLTVTVHAATDDGTATAPADYLSAVGTVTFSPGQTTQQFTVPVNGDTASECDETFTVTLTSPTNATIGKAQGTATILDDDATIPTPTLTPTAPLSPTPTATSTQTPTPPIATLTPTVTPAPQPVTVSVSHAGANRLAITVMANGAAGKLQQVAWTPSPNISVEDAVGAPITGGVLVLPPNSSVALFYLRRVSGTTATLPLTLTGSFGTWRTFVGGGPDAW